VRVHFVDFETFPLARSTLGPYRVHFVDLTKMAMARSTLCTLLAAGSSTSLPHAREDIVDLSPCRITTSTSFPVVSWESA
jgi:hypothetical protein